jgi:hypothetical protein
MPTLVVQHLLDHVRLRAEVRHSRGDSLSDVVNRPTFHARPLVKFIHCLGPTRKTMRALPE